MAISWAPPIVAAPGLPVAPVALAPSELLHAWRAGDPSALDRLMPLLYDELSRQAHVALATERGDHTLETRALVRAVCLRLMDADVQWQDSAHFFALAARTMRRILVDHAKSRVSLDVVCGFDGPCTDVLAVHQALDRLAQQDTRKAELIELHYFGGLNQQELADVQQGSLRTVERELRLARAWLRREMRGEA